MHIIIIFSKHSLLLCYPIWNVLYLHVVLLLHAWFSNSCWFNICFIHVKKLQPTALRCPPRTGPSDFPWPSSLTRPMTSVWALRSMWIANVGTTMSILKIQVFKHDLDFFKFDPPRKEIEGVMHPHGKFGTQLGAKPWVPPNLRSLSSQIQLLK